MIDKWQKLYNSKLITVEDFPGLLRDGDEWQNALGTAAVSPKFHQAVIDNYESLHGIRYSDQVQVKPHGFMNNDLLLKMHGHVDYNGWYWLPALGKFTTDTVADFSPIMTEDCTAAISRYANVFTFQCTPPNEQGYVNLGLCNFFHKDLIERGRKTGALRTVVAQVNDQMPTVFGDNWVHISDIDYIIELSEPVPEFGHAGADEIDDKVAQNVLELIKDGDCIQMGLGGLSEACIKYLDNFKNLGINSEMLPMDLPHLVEKGCVTNMNKVNHRGVSTATLIMGDKRLYDFCTENPSVGIYCCDYVNHPMTIAENPQQVAINSALMVDISGQICAESAGFRQISGSGGQLDFAIGAHWSKAGRSIVMVRSAHTDRNGNLVSNIVPSIPEGTTVTVPRSYADFVVTEYGVASLRGKSRRARAKELINVCHPDLRPQLRKAALDGLYPESMRTDEFFDYDWSRKPYGHPGEFWYPNQK